MLKKSISLQTHIGSAFIIAHNEQTDLLRDTLMSEGLICEVLRQVPQPEFQTYSPSYLALLNHRRAWERAIALSAPTLIVEADFVPVKGLGQLPLPFPGDQEQVGLAWIYTCAPQMYSVSQEGYAQGYSSSMVAYIVTPKGAQILIDWAEEIRQTIGPTVYSSWDSSIDPFLRQRGLQNFIPFRNYGEHGGRPNPEHQQHGLSRSHRADVLYGDLAFMPLYALPETVKPSDVVSWSSRWTYVQVRSHARLKGLVRLISGKYLRFKIVRNSSVPMWLLSFAVRRQASLRL